MRIITKTTRFQKNYKRQEKRGSDMQKLVALVRQLCEFGKVPLQFRPHLLTGEWKGASECHIEPDWLLIYEVNETEVMLYRTGTHADLFE